jgi:SAM-dependent methyltransferase
MSNAWEAWYASGNAIAGHYPAFEKMILTHVVEAARVLELGAGFGATIPFLRDHYGQYHGIEGSPTAVAALHARFPYLAPFIKCADFCREIPFEPGFDLIVDRASIAHNDLDAIRRCLRLAWQALKPGGLLICADWFSASHSEASRTAHPDGQFAGVGRVHFSSQTEIEELFAPFQGIHLEEVSNRRAGPNALVPEPINFRYISTAFAGQDYVSAVWNIVVRKPA